MEKVRCVTVIGLDGIKRVKTLKIYNIGAIMLAKIASTQINRLRCDPHKKMSRWSWGIQ